MALMPFDDHSNLFFLSLNLDVTCADPGNGRRASPPNESRHRRVIGAVREDLTTP